MWCVVGFSVGPRSLVFASALVRSFIVTTCLTILQAAIWFFFFIWLTLPYNAMAHSEYGIVSALRSYVCMIAANATQNYSI